MLERERLAKLGKSFWSFENEVLASWVLTSVLTVGCVAMFGWIVLPFIVVHHFYAWYGLTQANYVEHYGLLRQKLPTGRYELPEPRHSWNTNHIYSNLVSFHLQRHSDHHANALRPYQALRDFKDLPRLPSGYPGCFGLAAIPPLWFKVMDPKLMEWAGGDITKINVDPKHRERLYAKYGKSAHGALQHA
jgi:alkane 1-monooxygenase